MNFICITKKYKLNGLKAIISKLFAASDPNLLKASSRSVVEYCDQNNSGK